MTTPAPAGTVFFLDQDYLQGLKWVAQARGAHPLARYHVAGSRARTNISGPSNALRAARAPAAGRRARPDCNADKRRDLFDARGPGVGDELTRQGGANSESLVGVGDLERDLAAASEANKARDRHRRGIAVDEGDKRMVGRVDGREPAQLHLPQPGLHAVEARPPRRLAEPLEDGLHRRGVAVPERTDEDLRPVLRASRRACSFPLLLGVVGYQPGDDLRVAEQQLHALPFFLGHASISRLMSTNLRPRQRERFIASQRDVPPPSPPSVDGRRAALSKRSAFGSPLAPASPLASPDKSADDPG